MKKSKLIFTFLSAVGFGTPILAAPINLADYNTITRNIVDFSDISTANFPGVIYDEILVSGGVSFAERFQGQTLSFNGDLDVLSGTPSGPLMLLPGAAGQNLSGGSEFGFVGLYPCGFRECANGDGYGEGAFAILFPDPVSSFGFQATFSDVGSAIVVDFFRIDGVLLDSVTVNISNGGFEIDGFGFTREGGVKDIAGVSIYTTDPGGLGYSNIRSDLAPIPLPAGIWLLGPAIAGLSFTRRRRLSTGPLAAEPS